MKLSQLKHTIFRLTITEYHNAAILTCGIMAFYAVLVASTAFNASAINEFGTPKAVLNTSKIKHVKRITPQIPHANRNQKNKVFIENADQLIADAAISPDYQILKGNVKFRHGGMHMSCDSAYFYQSTGSLDAFGNVKMKQGDTLFVYADILHYYGDDQFAELRYNVKLENRNAVLTTDSLDYEVLYKVGHYFEGGKIYDRSSATTLTSEYGSYELDSKQSQFTTNVWLHNSKYDLRTDELLYNLRSHTASIYTPTILTAKKDSTVLRSSNGWYNTSNDEASLFDGSTIESKDGRTLTGDTLYYDKTKNYGYAQGHVVITDQEHHIILNGEFGYHNDTANVSYVTRKALAREFSQTDTTYLHADTLRLIVNTDSSRTLHAISKVRLYRNDLQGVCDTLKYNEKDSLINMYKHATLWNEARQITGPIIIVHLKDSTADWATLPNTGFMTEEIGENSFNQLYGREMKAYFEAKELRQLDVNGNVMVLLYPQENDSTYNKLINAESSFLKVQLKPKQQIDKIKMWPEVTGKVVPLYLAKRSQLRLEGFKWLAALRPKEPYDVMLVPEAMINEFNDDDSSK